MTCKYCGAELTAAGLFCQKCGMKHQEQQPVSASGLRISNNLQENGAESSALHRNAADTSFRGMDQPSAAKDAPTNLYVSGGAPIRPQPMMKHQEPPKKKKTWIVFVIAGVLIAAVLVAAVLLIVQKDDADQTSQTDDFSQNDPVAAEPSTVTEEQSLSIRDASELFGDWVHYKTEENLPYACKINLGEDGSARLGYYCIIADGGYDYRGTWKVISKQDQTYVIELSVVGGVAAELTPDDQIIYEQNTYCFELTLSRNDYGLYIGRTGCDLPPIVCFETYEFFSIEKENEFLDEYANQGN